MLFAPLMAWLLPDNPATEKGLSNQLLEWDFPQQEIWATEGILVGHGGDALVSCLWKKLQAAPLLAIAPVHRVGYWLEIK